MGFFRDRSDAADRLVAMLPASVGRDWVILALPRGGVPIAEKIARHLDAPLELMVVRKVGAPGNPELAVAAVSGPGRGERVVNDDLARMLGLSEADVDRLAQPQIAEIERRRGLWGRAGGSLALKDRDVLIVDDGAATGATLRAAVAAAHGADARRIGVALPVALGDALQNLPRDVAPIICPHPAAGFSAIGLAYDAFPQVPDSEVARIMAATGPDGRFARR